MELTQTEPRSPGLGLYKTAGSIAVPFVAVMLLIIVVLESRAPRLGASAWIWA